MKKFLNEFKEFAMRGNVVDMAVGVIIGAAFGKIVTSLVNDIIMPVIGVITGGTNFSEYKWVIKEGVTRNHHSRSGRDMGRFRADYCRFPHHRFLYFRGDKIHQQAQP